MRNRRAFLVMAFVLSVGDVAAEERWVQAVTSTPEWAVFPCRDRLITNVCWTDKDYGDPGTLPPRIAVGDTIRYVNKRGETVALTVKSISFFRFDKDIDTTWGGQRLIAKKGETSCNLYDTTSRRTIDKGYPSKIVIKGCQIVHE